MGFRRKLIFLLGGLFLVALGQIAFGLFQAAVMGRTLQTMSDRLIGDLTGVIQNSENDLAKARLSAVASDLTSLFRATEGQTLILANYFLTQARANRVAPGHFEFLNQEIEKACLSFLREREDIYNGIGATFEKGLFDPKAPYYEPYAYREDGKLVYDHVQEIGDLDPNSVTPEILESLFQAELQEEYYLSSAPKDGRLPPLKVAWTKPYVDLITRDLLISATAPIIDGDKFLGVVFVDLSLNSLTQSIKAIGESLSADRILAFSPSTFDILAIEGQNALAPREIPDPEDPKTTTIGLSQLSELPEGERAARIYKNLAKGDSAQAIVSIDGVDHAIVLRDMENILGILAVIPVDKFYASVLKAKENQLSLDAEEKRVVRNNILTSASSVSFLAVIVVFAIVYLLKTTSQLLEVTKTLNRESASIAHTADSVKSLAEVLANGEESLSKALTTISEAMRDISGHSHSAANSTGSCEAAMTKTAEQIIQGTKNVIDMRQAMDAISNATTEISNILKTIETIAFQTNLLALNAAVEASRAGESGAGFAVVAGEVRNLAGMSGEAAHKTGELLSQALNKAEQGQKVSVSLESSFQGIEEAIVEATSQIQAISVGSLEQISGLDDIATSIKSLEEIAHKTEKASKDSIANSNRLSEKASILASAASDLARLVGGGGIERE
jgi:methyl-accepting chemotaxis protein